MSDLTERMAAIDVTLKTLQDQWAGPGHAMLRDPWRDPV